MLGIETSCDETGIAIYDSERGLLAHVLRTQAPLHANYGGVVPELASRDHVRHIIPLIRSALWEAGCEARDLGVPAIPRGQASSAHFSPGPPWRAA